MSSFVVSKIDFVKCAGYVAGIAENYNRGGHNDFWLWDNVANKNTDTELFYRRFVQCFEMNAKSVQEQYHDAAPETDENEYKTEFNAYRLKGKGLMFDTKEQQIQSIADIRQFFKGVLYQVENERMHFLMSHWFNQITDELTEKFIFNAYESSNWGQFDITSDKETATA